MNTTATYTNIEMKDLLTYEISKSSAMLYYTTTNTATR